MKMLMDIYQIMVNTAH